MRVLQARCTKESLLTVKQSKRWSRRMVYILVANRTFKYRSGRRSRIIYIGTTGKGANRPATSAVAKASAAFKEIHGVKEIKTHIVTCKGRPSVRTWEQLESALLATFRELHFDLPKYNRKQGSNSDTEEIRLFRVKALKKLISVFAD